LLDIELFVVRDDWTKSRKNSGDFLATIELQQSEGELTWLKRKRGQKQQYEGSAGRLERNIALKTRIRRGEPYRS
jgi:hypothetical protein